jgi:hypothetical protein
MTTLVYITSPSFSGSTLLTFLLAAHPRVATVGELKATARGDIDKYHCSCGVPIRTCSYWKRLGEELAHRGVSFDVANFGTHFAFERSGPLANRVVRADLRGPAFEAARSLAIRLLPGAHREFEDILERNRVMIDTICRMRDAHVFVDGSKDSNRLKYMVDSGLWDVRVVFLVRDGRGVTLSRLKRLGRPVAEADHDTVRAVASEWRRTLEGCEIALGQLPRESWGVARYEDLCRDPEGTLVPIFRLMGVSPVDVPEDFRRIEHHILGNYMRLKGGRIGLDEEWRTVLSPRQLAAFDRAAGSFNRRHGYD